jgi:rod shape determining protein RodA
MEEQNKFSSRIDFSLVTILLLLCVGSCLAIYSAQTTGQYAENFLIKQIFGI